MFYPAVPGSVVPEGLLNKADRFVKSLECGGTDFGSVQKHIDEGNQGGEAKRGSELRDFEKFIQEHDAERLYAGLCRVCDKATGNAMWVTEESKSEMQNINVRGGAGDQVGCDSTRLPSPPFNTSSTGFAGDTTANAPQLPSSGHSSSSSDTGLEKKIDKMEGEMRALRVDQKAQMETLRDDQKAQMEVQKAQMEVQKAQMKKLEMLILALSSQGSSSAAVTLPKKSKLSNPFAKKGGD
jgi:hypothetical protein